MYETPSSFADHQQSCDDADSAIRCLPQSKSGFCAGISSEELQLSCSLAQTQPLYRKRSSRGGALTIAVILCLIVLCWNEARDYLYGQQHTSFKVDNHIEQEMQINFDATVAMPCHYLTIDIRDAVGDRLHISDSEFQKDGTTFEIGHAGRIDSIPQRDLSVGGTISASKKKNSKSMFQKEGRPAGPHQASFSRTSHIVPDGPACRIFGSMNAKKVTGNLHITTLGHGYWSWSTRTIRS
ncbi:hypothetical protein L7F22_007873 [Adiantum nelumboides]|nr:hypothetical protein [Adiantum nelumboides]